MTTFTTSEGQPAEAWSQAVLDQIEQIKLRRKLEVSMQAALPHRQPTQPDDDWTHPIIHGVSPDRDPLAACILHGPHPHGDNHCPDCPECNRPVSRQFRVLDEDQLLELAELKTFRNQMFKLLEAMIGLELPFSLMVPHRDTLMMAIALGFKADWPDDWSEAPDGASRKARESFERWWTQLVRDHAGIIQEKAEEYGTNSLVEIGRLYARARGRDQVPVAEAVEIGCAVYAYGKIQRVNDALLKDRLPSEDTWRDAMIYAAMALYAREHGRWP